MYPISAVLSIWWFMAYYFCNNLTARMRFVSFYVITAQLVVCWKICWTLINGAEQVKGLLGCVGRDSSIGIATCYGLDGPEIKSRWERDFPHQSIAALCLNQPHAQWVPGSFPGVKLTRAWPWQLTPHLGSSLRKSRAVPLPPPPLRAFMACPRVNFTFCRL